MATAYLGLGSNLGDRSANLRAALDALARAMKVEQVSATYETEPWGYKDQPSFLNAVARVGASFSPRELLAFVKEIESSLGRTATFRYGPRAIDIDILLYENEVVDEPDLAIPHPRLLDRAFALVPLAEIAPELMHPKEGKTMKELASKVNSKETVRSWKVPEANP